MFAVSVFDWNALRVATLAVSTPKVETLPVVVLLIKALSVVTFAKLTTSEAT